MQTTASIRSGEEDETINLRLWLGLLLPPIAGGINTIVGYIVSNFDCNVHNRHLVALVNVSAALLCVAAAITALSARRRFTTPTDESSVALLHTRQFMLRLGLSLAAGFLLFISAGSLSTMLLRPCDL